MNRIAFFTILLVAVLAATAGAQVTWNTITGPVSDTATAYNHIGTDGTSLYVVFSNNTFYKYSFTTGDPLNGTWTQLPTPPRTVNATNSWSDMTYQGGYLYTSAIPSDGNTSYRTLLKYSITQNTWTVAGSGSDWKSCKTTGNGIFMDPTTESKGYSAQAGTTYWVYFIFNTRSNSNSWMSTSGLGVTDSNWVSRNEDVAVGDLIGSTRTWYATHNDKTAGLSGGDVIYKWTSLATHQPTSLVQKPWQAGFGQAIEFIPAGYTPSAHPELWMIRGSDAATDAGNGLGNPTNNWARLDLSNNAWTTGTLPGTVGYDGEIVSVNGAVFVRGANATWYVANIAKPVSKTIKVLVLNFDPIIESRGGVRVHQLYGWADPHAQAPEYINDLSECSYNWVKYQVVDWVDADYFPVKIDGFQYTDDTYTYAWEHGGPFHSPDETDYYRVISDYNIAARVASGEIDEVLMFGGPYWGFYESRMAGPTSYWCNGGEMRDVPSVRDFVIMGFNFERGVDCMLEDYCHRTESIMWHVYGSWNSYPPQHNWDKWTLLDKNIQNHTLYKSGCGRCHFSPNSLSDYEWGRVTYVNSTCDDWLYNWPNLTGTYKSVNRAEWGSGDQTLHHKWWFKHIPHADGVNPDGKQNNWWKYLADFNSYPES